MFTMPALTTHRLIIRPFVMDDFDDVHTLLDIEMNAADLHTEKARSLAERAQWLQWSMLNHLQLARLHQPPYGDRAVQLKATGELVGACGYVPLLAPFEQIPYFAGNGNGHHFAGAGPKGAGSTGTGQRPGPTTAIKYTPEIGLFYAISQRHQAQGYATEAAEALVGYAFEYLHLKRIIATTDYDNPASMAVMKKLGMRIERNPCPEPIWMQIVGVLENPANLGT